MKPQAAVPATADAIRNLFVAQGWVPYGNAGDTAVFKQNANLATVTVSSAPAQGGKTMIQYSNQLISADIPAPPNVEDLRYVDEPPELNVCDDEPGRHRRFLSKDSGRRGLEIHDG